MEGHLLSLWSLSPKSRDTALTYDGDNCHDPCMCPWDQAPEWEQFKLTHACGPGPCCFPCTLELSDASVPQNTLVLF